jgi:uncharacterized protein
LIDGDEADHRVCVETLSRLALPLVTTWPAFTEAMYLRHRRPGCTVPVRSGRFELADLSLASLDRVAALVEKYADRPMDLAHASLVALAELRGERRIFTLDRHFTIYRLSGRRRFDVVPG